MYFNRFVGRIGKTNRTSRMLESDRPGREFRCDCLCQTSDASGDTERSGHGRRFIKLSDGAVRRLEQNFAIAKLFVMRNAKLLQQPRDQWLAFPEPRGPHVTLGTKSTTGCLIVEGKNTAADSLPRFEQDDVKASSL